MRNRMVGDKSDRKSADESNEKGKADTWKADRSSYLPHRKDIVFRPGRSLLAVEVASAWTRRQPMWHLHWCNIASQFSPSAYEKAPAE